MNINLISPEENGNDYTIRFKEDVIVPENSSVYLNFASFSRENGVEFFDDQTLTILSNEADIRPSHIPEHPFNKNTLFATGKNKFTIPAGQYSYRLLYKKITDGINGLLTQADNVADLLRYRGIAQSDIDKNSSQFLEEEIDLSLGLMKQDIDVLNVGNPPSFTIDTANSRNCENNDTGVYVKNNATAVVPSGQVKGMVSFVNGIVETVDTFVVGTKDKTDGAFIGVATTSSGTGTGLTVSFGVAGGEIRGPGVTGIGISVNTFVVGATTKTDGVYTDVACLGGSGNGFTVSYTVAAGTVPAFGNAAGELKISSGGTGYTVGDTLTIQTTGPGGSQNTTFNIATIGTGVVIVDKGTGYAVDDTITIPNGVVGGTPDTTFDIATISDNVGPADRTAGSYYNVATTTAGGGQGLTLQFTIPNTAAGKGAIPTFGTSNVFTQIFGWGKGYAVGDKITVDLTSAGNGATPVGGTGTTDFTITTLNPVAAGGPQRIWDNYALSTERYWYLNYDDDTPVRELNIITFETIQSATEMSVAKERVVIGLQSHPALSTGLVGVKGGWPSDAPRKTGGTNEAIFTGTGSGVNGAGQGLNGQYRNPKQFPADNLGESKKAIGGLVTVCINCDPTNPILEIKCGLAQTNKLLSEFRGQQENITGMKPLVPNGIKLSNIPGYDLDKPFKGGLYTYYGMDNLGNRNLYFRILNFNTTYDSTLPMSKNQQLIIYDSRTDPTNPTHFLDTFLVQTNKASLDYETGGVGEVASVSLGNANKNDGNYTNMATVSQGSDGSDLTLDFTVTASQITPASVAINTIGYGYKIGDEIVVPVEQGLGGTGEIKFKISANDAAIRKHKYDSQMPFCVMASAQTLGGGFSSIRIPNYTQSYTKPVSGLIKYEIEATEELASYINASTSKDRLDPDFISRDLFPNTGDAMNPNIIHLENMNLDWRNESYSIYINELPIKSYKNNNKQRSGGYGKTVLANCPVPFSDGQTYKASEKQLITSVYKPNYQVINNLYNQTLATNHFRVEIRKLASDKPATEILKSIVNFTIVPPSDYKGNINSIDSL